jgi:FkbM family methyltransferase
MLNRLVPPLVRDFWQRALSEPAQRVIVETATNVRAYVHPHSNLGRSILADGRYEIDTENIFLEEIRPGDVFLDVGANEGYLSAMAARLVGSAGFVIAVEPQSRLQALIEINMRLNGAEKFHVLHRALGPASDKTAHINLYPEANTGQSSLLKKPRFGWTTLRQQQEEVRFITPAEILAECQVDHFDFIKVDVEGFEYSVVDALLPLIRDGRVGKLLLDYHAEILKKFGIDADGIHRKLMDAGMTVMRGDSRHLSSYVLYARKVPPAA